MANEFALEPGLGNFPSLLAEVASRINEAQAQIGGVGGCAMYQGDSNGYWDLWQQRRASLQNEAAWLQSFADGFAGAGSTFRASDGG